MFKISGSSVTSVLLTRPSAARRDAAVQNGLADLLLGIGEEVYLDVSHAFRDTSSYAIAPSSPPLPAMLSLSSTGTLTGAVTAPFDGTVIIRGRNAFSHADTPLRITVVAAPAAIVAPLIAGTARVGHGISAVAGDWADATAVTTTLLVGGAGRPSPYVIQPSDDGATVIVRDHATGPGGEASADSPSRTVRWPAPALDALADVTLEAGSGPFQLQATGTGLAGGNWTLTGAAIAVIDQQGLVTIDTATPTVATITVRYTNSGGSAAESFTIGIETLTAAPTASFTEADWSVSDAAAVDGAGLILSINTIPVTDPAINAIDYTIDDGIHWTDLDTATRVSTEDSIKFTNMSDAETVTFSVYEPVEKAGTYIVPVALLETGPVNLVPPAVVEDAGTYTATPGLWAYAADQAPLFAYEWRLGPTVLTADDGVSADGLSLTPGAAVLAETNLLGLSFTEIGEGVSGPQSETIQVLAPRTLTAVRFDPATPGLLGLAAGGTVPGHTRWSVLARVKARNLAQHQYIFGEQYRGDGGIRTNGQWRIQAREIYGASYVDSYQAGGKAVAGQWHAAWFNADREAAVTNGAAIVLTVDGVKTVIGDATVGAANSLHPITRLGGMGAGSLISHVFDGELDLFVAIFHGHAFDTDQPGLWAEVFDPAAGHAIRPEYLDGSKQTIGGVMPSVILRGPGLITANNEAPGGLAWQVYGAAPEAVFA